MEDELIPSAGVTADEGAVAPENPPISEIADDAGAEANKPNNGIQKRIDELTRQREDAKRESEFWKAEALKASKPPEPPPPPAKAPEKPTLDKFSSFEEYNEALIQYNLDQALSKTTAAQTEKAQIEQARTVFKSRVDAFRATTPDFDTVFNDKTPVTPVMAEVIMGSDLGAEIAYQLGKNPTEAARISGLTPHQQAAAIGRIEGNLRALKTRTHVPGAPAPLEPVKGGSTADEDNLSPEEWILKRNREQRAKETGQKR
jgi:hypothetical protein